MLIEELEALCRRLGSCLESDHIQVNVIVHDGEIRSLRIVTANGDIVHFGGNYDGSLSVHIEEVKR